MANEISGIKEVVRAMALIEYDEYKQKLRDLGPELEKLSAALDMDSARAEAAKLEDETAQDGFWNDLERSQKVQQRLKQLQNKIARQDKLVSEWQDLTALCEMGQEAEDEELLAELKEGFQTLEEKIEESRMATLLSGEYDGHSAILTFHAGAGGTEAQDWAQMLYRMYTRWTERHDFTYQILDYEDGDEAGIKSASIAIQGENAYGLLKSENGVHRLVRRGGHARDRGRRRGGDPGRGHRDAGLPGQRRRRPARQQDLLRRAPDPQAHGHRGGLSAGAQPVPE